MMLTLDELDPLIEPQASAATLTPCDESDGQESNDASVELGRDVENVDEEEAEEKDVVTWSADDEKNLRNLGTLEIERNQRLENLIAKCIARKRWMVEAEKNLIDLDGDGMQITIPMRRNPFDPQYDFDEVPGSAPPILLPRLNPCPQLRHRTPQGRQASLLPLRRRLLRLQPLPHRLRAPQAWHLPQFRLRPQTHLLHLASLPPGSADAAPDLLSLRGGNPEVHRHPPPLRLSVIFLPNSPSCNRR